MSEDESRQDPAGSEERSQKSSEVKPPAIWSVLVGIAFCALIVVAVVNSVSNSDGGILGSEDDSGRVLPDFAVPDALGPLVGDANIDQTDCVSDRRPCPAEARRTPACEVRLEGAIRSCDLFERPAVISFWFTRGGECEDQQDVFEEVYRRFAGTVSFLAVNVRDDRATVRGLIRERGWTHPTGLDPDGALSNLLRVGGCPTLLFVRPGGVLEKVALGNQTAATLSAKVERLIETSRPADEKRKS